MSRLPNFLVCVVLMSGVAGAATPRFDIEIEAVLSKAGCNAGTCHGNQNGKGGFKLSLRGQDPKFDFDAMTRADGGRRIDRLDAANSLLLKKPTTQVAHQGGKRLDPSGQLYRQLLAWISSGAPAPTLSKTVDELVVTPSEAICFAPETSVPLSVVAKFSDGTKTNVTDVAVYEASNLNVSISSSGTIQREAVGEATVIVRYLDQQVPVPVAFLDARPDFEWVERSPRNYIDEHTFAKMKKFRALPAPRCADHVYLRRVYLDLLGIVPSADQARAFLGSDDANKRDQVVASLLFRPEFADHWALKWADLLRVEEKVLDRKGVETFHGWIRQSIAEGLPLNEFVAALLLARGSTYDNPPTNFFRALRSTSVRGEAAARVFLGTRLQCAQCHNHPFDRWTQDDYYAWAALFSRVDYRIPELKRLDKLDKNQFVGEQFVEIKADASKVKHPETGEVVPPRFLGTPAEIDAQSDRLAELARWLTSPDNRQFAKAQVNRIWYHLMGRGLVSPVDDFRITNPASHPALLNALTDDFIAHDFDIRHLIRRIVQSETYQMGPSESNATDTYASVEARRLAAEQLLDSQASALESSVGFNGHAVGMRAAELPGVHKVRQREKPPSPADRFLFAFGKPERLMTCECERSDATTLSQALLLVNGECIDNLLTSPSNLISRLIDDGATLDDVIEELYWSTLSRPPSSDERHQAHSILARSASNREGLEDVAWALLNAKEFIFRQ